MKKNQEWFNLLLSPVKFLLALAWALLILVLMTASLAGPESAAKGFTVSDKLIHIFLFGVLAALLFNFWRGFKRWPLRLIYLASFLSAAAWAYGCEYLQRFVPLRNSSLYDFAFALGGIILALFIFKLSSRGASDNERRGDPPAGRRVATPCSAGWRIRARNDRESKPKLLLHLCCGPCGAALSGDLTGDFQPTIFFSNSNIDSRREFNKRLRQVKKVARANGLKVTVDNYNHQEWRQVIAGQETAPERGSRCLLCYAYRLQRTAQLARAEGFNFFTTSLSVSPFKDGQAVLQLGKQAAAKFQVKFLDKNFNGANGWQRALAAAKGLQLYRQNYCGCEFSRRREK